MWRQVLVGLGLIAAATAAAPAAQAQDQAVGVTLGYFTVRGEDGRPTGDVMLANRCIDVTFACEPLLFEASDFNGPAIGAEWLLGWGEFVVVAASIGFSQQTVPSIYEFLESSDGSEIEQDLKLRLVPLTATVRFIPTGRRSGFQPYIGAGLGIINWRYSETGEFVDVFTQDIFRASYDDSGTEFGPVVVGGVRAPMGDVFLLGAEIKWHAAEGDLSDDFVGDRIDLGGVTYQVTFHFRF